MEDPTVSAVPNNICVTLPSSFLSRVLESVRVIENLIGDVRFPIYFPEMNLRLLSNHVVVNFVCEI